MPPARSQKVPRARSAHTAVPVADDDEFSSLSVTTVTSSSHDGDTSTDHGDDAGRGDSDGYITASSSSGEARSSDEGRQRGARRKDRRKEASKQVLNQPPSSTTRRSESEPRRTESHIRRSRPQQHHGHSSSSSRRHGRDRGRDRASRNVDEAASVGRGGGGSGGGFKLFSHIDRCLESVAHKSAAFFSSKSQRSHSSRGSSERHRKRRNKENDDERRRDENSAGPGAGLSRRGGNPKAPTPASDGTTIIIDSSDNSDDAGKNSGKQNRQWKANGCVSAVASFFCASGDEDDASVAGTKSGNGSANGGAPKYTKAPVNKDLRTEVKKKVDKMENDKDEDDCCSPLEDAVWDLLAAPPPHPLLVLLLMVTSFFFALSTSSIAIDDTVYALPDLRERLLRHEIDKIRHTPPHHVIALHGDLRPSADAAKEGLKREKSEMNEQIAAVKAMTLSELITKERSTSDEAQLWAVIKSLSIEGYGVDEYFARKEELDRQEQTRKDTAAVKEIDADAANGGDTKGADNDDEQRARRAKRARIEFNARRPRRRRRHPLTAVDGGSFTGPLLYLAHRLVAANATLAHFNTVLDSIRSNRNPITGRKFESSVGVRGDDDDAAMAQQLPLGSLRRSIETDVADLKKLKKETLKNLAEATAAVSQGVGANGAQIGQLQKQLAPAVPQKIVDEAIESGDPIPGGPWIPSNEWIDQLGPSDKNEKRKQRVVAALRHSWKGYRTYAWGWDELQPRSRKGKSWNEDSPHSIALTVLDAVTTLHLMGCTREVEEALVFIRGRIRFDVDLSISVFETNIRVLGSLLSMYEMTEEKDRRLLDLAKEVADRILYAFNTRTGIPHQTVNLKSHRHFSAEWTGGSSLLSEFGTMQLEMRTLSFHTKNPIYDQKATHIMQVIDARAPKDFLCPVHMSVVTSKWASDHVSIGALGDSFYEYLVKQYVLTGDVELKYLRMTNAALDGIIEKLYFKSKPSKLGYLAEFKRGEYFHKMDELACFSGGMFALAAHHQTRDSDRNGERKKRYMEVAEDLTNTCWLMYHKQLSGLAPEYVEFLSGRDFVNGAGYYLLRPETLESLFYMWRFTKEQKYRDRGWSIFRAIETFGRVETGGFCGIREVNVKHPKKDDLQQSFWFAETLKYLGLLFSDDDALDLSKWVLNTEGHPLRIRRRDPLDVWREYEQSHDGKIPWRAPVLYGVEEVETELMKKARIDGGVRFHRPPTKDQFGEEMDGGAGDDDAAPFDVIRGMKGLPPGGRRRGEEDGPAREGGGRPPVPTVGPEEALNYRPPADAAVIPHQQGGGGVPSREAAGRAERLRIALEKQRLQRKAEEHR